MKKEELIKRLEEKVVTLKTCQNAFERIGDEKTAINYFWQAYELQEVLKDIRKLED